MFRVRECFVANETEYSNSVNAALSHFTKGHPLLTQVMNETKTVFTPGGRRELVGPLLVSNVVRRYLGQPKHIRRIKNLNSQR